MVIKHDRLATTVFQTKRPSFEKTAVYVIKRTADSIITDKLKHALCRCLVYLQINCGVRLYVNTDNYDFSN